MVHRVIDNLKDNLISYIFVAIFTTIIGATLGYTQKDSTFYSVCPVYPVGGEAVAKELKRLPVQEYPALWEWLGRIDKLRQELEVCR